MIVRKVGALMPATVLARRADGLPAILVLIVQKQAATRRDGVQHSERRALLVSKGWIQAVALVILFGFFVLGLLAYRTYVAKPPTPQRVVDPAGAVLYTGEDISRGQQVFLHNGLMEYGSVFGHGAYLSRPGLHRRLPAARG